MSLLASAWEPTLDALRFAVAMNLVATLCLAVAVLTLLLIVRGQRK
jgi:hypothetical protein